MAYIGHILGLAFTMTLMLLYSVWVIGGIVSGKMKSEPSQPWVRFRERPLRFVAMLLFRIVAACVFAVGSFKIGRDLLR
jgi:hypothetical protein